MRRRTRGALDRPSTRPAWTNHAANPPTHRPQGLPWLPPPAAALWTSWEARDAIQARSDGRYQRDSGRARRDAREGAAMARRRHAGWGKSIPHLWTSSETRSGEVKCHLGCAATANRAGTGNAAVRACRARGMREAGGHLGSLRGVEWRLHHTCCGPAAEDGNRQGVVSA